MSQRIAVLEKELHVSLFNRRAGRISLSDAGQRLYRYARQILELHGQARTEIGGFRPIVAGDLPIAASSVPGECFLPALLSAFHEKYPSVHVRATVGDSGSVIEDIEKGRATLGLVGQEAEKPSLEFRPIGSDTLVLVVAPGHRWAARKRIPLKALTGEPLIIRERGSGSRCCLGKEPGACWCIARRAEYHARARQQRGHQGCRQTRPRGSPSSRGWPSNGRSTPTNCGRSRSAVFRLPGISIWSITAAVRSHRRRPSSCTFSNRTPSARRCHKLGLWGSCGLSPKTRLPVLRPAANDSGCAAVYGERFARRANAMVETDLKAHWEHVYSTKGATGVSWYQSEPRLSMELIRAVAPAAGGRIIDVGGGASVLVDRLLDLPFERIAVLDIAETALVKARSRLGERAGRVEWIVADVTKIQDIGTFDVWHDRAVFHFLTDAADRRKYVGLALRTVPKGGHLIIASFADDGPKQCSDLDVCRYNVESIAAELGPDFALNLAIRETHATPWSALQPFYYGVFLRL